jgi:hypothetical protein
MQRLTQTRDSSIRPERCTFLSAMASPRLLWVSLRPRAAASANPPATQTLTAANPPRTDELTRLGTLINSAAHHALGPANCLTRSLYLWWLLRRRGIDSQLRIGVRLTDGALDAHAWVEHAGIPINDRQDVSTDFAPFADPVSPRLFTTP